MKKIIDGKLYDTGKATEIGSDSYGHPGDFDFENWSETLYVTPSGRYFTAGEGGPRSHYARTTGQNETSGGSDISAMSAEDAKAWAEKHLEAATYMAHFPAEDG